MNIAALRSNCVAFMLAWLATSGCHRPERASIQSPTPSASDAPAPITARTPDAFYDPPASRPHQPGVLLRHQLLANATLPNRVQGWRILYTTAVNDDTPATAIATVFASIDAAAAPRPVIAWEHGTTGLMQKCMPSLASEPARLIPCLEQIANAGWAVVATDYSFAEKDGPHPYLIGEAEARSALDSVRAAGQIPGLALNNNLVVWGHSEGGHAALWTGIVGPRYAPELNILGVAAIAPATNIRKILARDVAADKRYGPYLASAYSRFYPDIKFEDAVRPEALQAARQMVNQCDFVPPEGSERLEQLAASFEGPALALNSNKPLRDHLDQNTPDGPIAAPVVIAQGDSDTVVPSSVTDSYVAERCAAHLTLEYWTFARLDHFTIIELGSALRNYLIAWTAARVANKPTAKGCIRKFFNDHGDEVERGQ